MEFFEVSFKKTAAILTKKIETCYSAKSFSSSQIYSIGLISFL